MSHDTSLHESQHPLKAALRVAGVIVAALFLGFVLLIMTKDRAKADSLAKAPVPKQQRFDPIETVTKAAPGWSGVWVGAHVGYDIERQSTYQPIAPGFSLDLSTAADAFAYGGGMGIDHRLPGTRIVGGIMTDFSWTNAHKQSVINLGPGNSIVVGDAKIDRTWFYGARVGGLVTDHVLLYALAGRTEIYSHPAVGFTAGGVNLQDVLGDRHGWTYGLGLEAMASWGGTIKLEYRHTDVKDVQAVLVPIPGVAAADLASAIHEVRLGLGWKFDLLSGARGGAPLK